MQLVLNDLSLQFPVENQYEARKIMQMFLAAYRLAKEATGSDCLILDSSLPHLFLSEGYCVDQWRNDYEVDIEEKRLFRSLIQRSETYDAFSFDEESEFKISMSKQSSVGCLLAHLLDGCCLSFLCRSEWDTPFIQGDYLYLNDEDCEIESHTVSIPNIASAHTASVFSLSHTAKIQQHRRASFASGTSIVERISEFPNLELCENAKTQLLAEHGRKCTRQIARRLFELQEYFESADGGFDSDKLTHCTPESQSTLDQYKDAHTFTLPNGEEKLFSWHLRYTGEYAGRIFFFPDMTSKKCYIGHIGQKLPTSKYN